jgi:protein gp37
MGKKPGDILSCDWNPIIGCERYSVGCRRCWYLDGIFPWQQRFGNIPLDVLSNEHHVFEKRLTVNDLTKKRGGIIGVVQHGDLFWDKVPEGTIARVLDIVDEVASRKRDGTKYVLWTKRAERMVSLLVQRYPQGLPDYLAASVSVENQDCADQRLPYLMQLKGTRIIMLEPLLGPVSLKRYLPVEWVVVGSETGTGAHCIDSAWVSAIRDEVKASGIPFFIKQLGVSHTSQDRNLDGRAWNEFPSGWTK